MPNLQISSAYLEVEANNWTLVHVQSKLYSPFQQMLMFFGGTDTQHLFKSFHSRILRLKALAIESVKNVLGLL